MSSELVNDVTVENIQDYEMKLRKIYSDINVEERLDRQRILVELNSDLFPDYIKEYKSELGKMINDIPATGFWNIKAPQLLAGTVYEGYDKKKVLEAEIFKDMSKYIKPDNTVNTNALFE